MDCKWQKPVNLMYLRRLVKMYYLYWKSHPQSHGDYVKAKDYSCTSLIKTLFEIYLTWMFPNV